MGKIDSNPNEDGVRRNRHHSEKKRFF